jgi:hypothetical protein
MEEMIKYKYKQLFHLNLTIKIVLLKESRTLREVLPSWEPLSLN